MKTEKQKKNNGVVISNRYLIQSYIMTTAKYDFSKYEKRILYLLVEMAQCEVEGLSFPRDCCKIEHDLWGLTKVTMPIAPILSGEADKNYTKAKNAFLSLSKKGFEYEDGNSWEYINILAFPKIEKGAASVTFIIDPKIWNCCLDFSKGFRKYELVTAMQFKSVYSMRFYELMSGQKSKLIYSLEQLKEMFQVQDKYKLTADFIRKVIEPAKKELDEFSPYTFEWSPNKEGRKITSFNFYPVKQPEKQDSELYKYEIKKQTGLSWDLSKPVLEYLRKSIEFEPKEIKQHRDMFIRAQLEIPDFLSTLAELKGKSRDKRNPKGWIINAIRGKLKDLK